MSDANAIIRLPRTALAHLRRADPALARVMKRIGPFQLQAGNPEGPLCALCRSIVFQQLSGKAAGTIFSRLRAQFPAERFPTAEELLATSDQAIRGCGVSSQKLSYLRDLCQRVAQGQLDLPSLPSQNDEEVIKQLTAVRGIGRWSAQMFLMFYLGRLNVWPTADLGIRTAIRLLHGYTELPTAAEMDAMGARYHPYASVASYYLWRLLDLSKEERTSFLSEPPLSSGQTTPLAPGCAARNFVK